MNAKPNTIAFCLLLSGAAMSIFLFAASRNDPSLRIAALVSATGFVSSLGSVGSTLLTGKDVTGKAELSDLPPNTSLHTTQEATVNTPPAPQISA